MWQISRRRRAAILPHYILRAGHSIGARSNKTSSQKQKFRPLPRSRFLATEENIIRILGFGLSRLLDFGAGSLGNPDVSHLIVYAITLGGSWPTTWNFASNQLSNCANTSCEPRRWTDQEAGLTNPKKLTADSTSEIMSKRLETLRVRPIVSKVSNSCFVTSEPRISTTNSLRRSEKGRAEMAGRLKSNLGWNAAHHIDPPFISKTGNLVLPFLRKHFDTSVGFGHISFEQNPLFLVEGHCQVPGTMFPETMCWNTFFSSEFASENIGKVARG